MRRSLVLRRLLVFVSVLTITKAQTTTETTTTSASTPVPTAVPVPEIFYPFGTAVGDTEVLETGSETFRYVPFSTPLKFFGRNYNHIYVNNNGLLTFNSALNEADPYPFPANGTRDLIAALWADLDDIAIGKYWYQEYRSGSVLTRATQDINQHFPNVGFNASWVFVATWDYVLTRNMTLFTLRSEPTITYQVVFISGGGFSFILMNYGDCGVISISVEAGYDTVGSTDYYKIHYSTNGNFIPSLKNTTNVDVLGRWAFLVSNRSDISQTTTAPTTPPTTTTTIATTPATTTPPITTTPTTSPSTTTPTTLQTTYAPMTSPLTNQTRNVIGLRAKISSFLDLTDNVNMQTVLQQIKQELVKRGLPSNINLKFRKVKIITP